MKRKLCTAIGIVRTEFQRHELMKSSNSSSHSSHDYIVNGLSGFLAGACGIVVGHPFDTMKIRLQVGDLNKAPTVGAKNFLELYRGIVPPICTSACTQFMVFSIYESVKHGLINNKIRDNAITPDTNLEATFIAGTTAGAICSYVTSPLQLMKIQQQASPHDLSMRRCFQEAVKTRGIPGLFHGSVSVTFVEGVGRGIYMWTYEFFKREVSKFRFGGGQVVDNSTSTRAIAAAGAGAISWFVMYPLDSIKNRRLNDLSSKSSYESFKYIWKYGGIPGFYRGCGLAMIRSMPVAATVLPLYEHLREEIGKVVHNDRIVTKPNTF